MAVFRTVPAMALRVAAALLAACAAPPAEPDCTVGADCASGVCEAGRCRPFFAPDGGEAPDSGWTAPPDAGPSAPDAGPASDGGAPPTGCVPNHDGALQRSEFLLRAGTSAVYRVATDAEVDTDGETDAGGVRRWDLSGAMHDDHPATLAALAPAGQWWADAYPTASYAARLSQSSDLLGVFRISDDALVLLGVVSQEGGLYRTELTYDPPVRTLPFPVRAGDEWTTDSTVTGFYEGVAILAPFQDEVYESKADLRGELTTPFGPFPVLRVRTRMTRTVWTAWGPVVTDIRSHLFLAECFGTVATMTSPSGTTEDEFPVAAEVTRLAP